MVDYNAIKDYLAKSRGKIVTPSGIAYGIGEERIYGATMMKCVRNGWIEPCAEKGYYRIVKENI